MSRGTEVTKLGVAVEAELGGRDDRVAPFDTSA
jgi:hypothetical protein